MDISAKGLRLHIIWATGQGEVVSTYADDSNVAFTDWQDYSNELTLARCKLSVSMMIVDCPTAHTAQCSVHSRRSHRA